MTPADLATIGVLVLLEGALSADNALVLALLVRHLPPAEQKKALLYGLGGALLFRGVAILTAQWILQIWWLQGMGALYLAYLSVAHFVKPADHTPEPGRKAGPGLLRTIITVELTDIAFAIDSVLVAVALSSKLWVVYTGAVIGTVVMRVAATAFIALLRRYPLLEGVAYALIGWIAVKLASSTWDTYLLSGGQTEDAAHLLPQEIFWSGLVLIAAIGSWRAFRHRTSGPVAP